MDENIISLKAWRTMECDGFVCVGHRGHINNEFETVIVPIVGGNNYLKLEGRFNAIKADGLRDALQIHELTSATVAEWGNE